MNEPRDSKIKLTNVELSGFAIESLDYLCNFFKKDKIYLFQRALQIIQTLHIYDSKGYYLSTNLNPDLSEWKGTTILEVIEKLTEDTFPENTSKVTITLTPDVYKIVSDNAILGNYTNVEKFLINSIILFRILTERELNGKQLFVVHDGKITEIKII